MEKTLQVLIQYSALEAEVVGLFRYLQNILMAMEISVLQEAMALLAAEEVLAAGLLCIF